MSLPLELEAVIAAFDQNPNAFQVLEVSSALREARRSLGRLEPDDHASAFNELMAFSLIPAGEDSSPWRTYFGPMATLQDADGQRVYQPDISQADASTLSDWRRRADSVAHPILRARYADLVWDLGPTTAPGTKRDAGMGLRAANAYLEAAALPTAALGDAFAAAARALGLAIRLNNQAQRDAARAAILKLNNRAVDEGSHQSSAFDILMDQPKSGLTDDESASLVARLEAGLAAAADPSAAFDPNLAQSTARRLIAHYHRLHEPLEERRVHGIVARASEHSASLASALLASSILNGAMEAYKNAGEPEEAERVRRLLAEKVLQASAEMKEVQHVASVTFDEVEAFKAQIVTADPWETLARVAANFLLRRAAMEQSVAKEKEEAPLFSAIRQQIFDGDRQVASVGSAEDDPFGRVLRHALFSVSFQTPWLGWAMEAALERHRYGVGDLVAWCNQAGLFGDGVLLATGLEAWIEGDLIKAIHVLVPQVERGLRNLVESVGRPSTKPHPRFPGAQVAISMGDIIFNEDTAAALGKGGDDLLLHIATIYADSRGKNLRNDLAHGLLDYDAAEPGTLLWVAHTLLLLGLWRAPAPPEAAPEVSGPSGPT